jgi:hypothetical protein
MRLTLIIMAALACLLAATDVSSACPSGYVACGKFCCPK